MRAASTPPSQLASFIGKFNAADARRIRSLRRALRSRFKGAHELVYDNYNFFVIGYSPTERPSDAVVSLVAQANSVSLCFIQGARLADPHNLLRGSGNQTRSMQVDSAAVLRRPQVESLIAAAIAGARSPLDPTARGKLIIRSVSQKQRSRRK